MNSTIRPTNQLCIIIAAIATSLVIAAAPSMSRADAWELRTVDEEVPGTREIEAGNPEKAIRISKARLSATHPALRVAVLTNLCIGHILIRDFDQAEQYCDQAAAWSFERTVTHNNRGVLKALQGDYAAASQDFSIAANVGCFGACNASMRGPQNRPRPTARRNLEKTETRVAELKDATDAHRVAARAE